MKNELALSRHGKLSPASAMKWERSKLSGQRLRMRAAICLAVCLAICLDILRPAGFFSLPVDAAAGGPGERARAVAMSASGDRAVFAESDGTVVVWDTLRNRRLAWFRVATGPIASVGLMPSGEIVSIPLNPGEVECWSGSGRLLWRRGFPKARSEVAVSADGRRVAVGNDNGLLMVLDARREQLAGRPLCGGGMSDSVLSKPNSCSIGLLG